jgi:GntR family transcriptional regulator
MNLTPLDSGRPMAYIPKYFRIQQELLDNIRSNRWPAGSAIPSEVSLCKQYGVSRGTIRRALGELDHMGLIERCPGKPTVVKSPKIPLLARGFRSDIAKKGKHPGTTVLAIAHETVPMPVAQLLEIPYGTSALFIHRLVTADGVPVIIESVYAVGVREPVTPQEVEATSLLDLLPLKCRTVLARAVESYEPVKLDTRDARLLGVHPGALAIKDQAILYDTSDKPLYLSTALVRGDQARIVTEISFDVRPPTTSP